MRFYTIYCIDSFFSFCPLLFLYNLGWRGDTSPLSCMTRICQAGPEGKELPDIFKQKHASKTYNCRFFRGSIGSRATIKTYSHNKFHTYNTFDPMQNDAESQRLDYNPYQWPDVYLLHILRRFRVGFCKRFKIKLGNKLTQKCIIIFLLYSISVIEMWRKENLPVIHVLYLVEMDVIWIILYNLESLYAVITILLRIYLLTYVRQIIGKKEEGTNVCTPISFLWRENSKNNQI